jgi:ATP-dependent Clp protease protease subunit
MPAGEKKKSMPQPPALRLLLRERTIIIAKPVDRSLMERVTSQLLVLDGKNPGKLITVYVNSPGGDADSGFAIYDAMRFVKSPIRTICSGLAASAAVPIFPRRPQGRALSWPNSRPSCTSRRYRHGRRERHRDHQQRDRRVREVQLIVEEETGRAMAKVRTDTNRDFWLTAQEAVEYGLVTRIVTRATELD